MDKKALISLREMLRAGLMAALTAILAWVQIPLPFSPVPITGQTFGVMLAGSLLGAKTGFISMLLFLLLGIAGVPVFAGGRAGIGVLLGPTGGYLLAFPVAAYIIGLIAFPYSGQGGPIRMGLANLVGGILVIYTLGTIQLAFVARMDVQTAFVAGALYFIPGDLIKAVVATIAANRVRAVLPQFKVEGKGKA